MAIEYGYARSLVMEGLRKAMSQPRARSIEVNLPRILETRKDDGEPTNTSDVRIINQILHDLYLERIITTGNTSTVDSVQAMSWPYIWITEHGKRVLSEDEYSPYDPDGYLKRLRSDIQSVDDVIVAYVAESVECLRRDCLLASAVTIGCASERCVLLLIQAYGNAIADSKNKKPSPATQISFRSKRSMRN